MLVKSSGGARELCFPAHAFTSLSSSSTTVKLTLASQMRTSFSSSIRVLRSLAFSLSLNHHHYYQKHYQFNRSPSLFQSRSILRPNRHRSLSSPPSQQVVWNESDERVVEAPESVGLGFDVVGEAARDLKHLEAPRVEVRELEEVKEQWKRSKLAWLCKELPAHKPGTLVRILNGQRKWITQEDAMYVAHHCMRIRENETAFRVKSSSCCCCLTHRFCLIFCLCGVIVNSNFVKNLLGKP